VEVTNPQAYNGTQLITTVKSLIFKLEKDEKEHL
jgi:hypothetical protein